MKQRKLAGVAVVGTAVMAVLLGCGASPDPAPRAASPDVVTVETGPAETKEYAGSVSLVKFYGSLDELWVDTDLSVRGVAGGSTIEELGHMPFTVTEFFVEDSSDSAFIGQKIAIRQTGSTEFLAEGTTDILVKGEEYLLMLWVFRFEHDGPQYRVQYYITGGQGAWRLTGDDSAEAIFPNYGDKAPLSLDRADIAQVLKQPK
jgi:hypothetical protein